MYVEYIPLYVYTHSISYYLETLSKSITFYVCTLINPYRYLDKRRKIEKSSFFKSTISFLMYLQVGD